MTETDCLADFELKEAFNMTIVLTTDIDCV